MARFVEELPDVYRSVVHMHYWMDQSVEEIAGALDVPAGTVKSYLARARARLRERARARQPPGVARWRAARWWLAAPWLMAAGASVAILTHLASSRCAAAPSSPNRGKNRQPRKHPKGRR